MKKKKKIFNSHIQYMTLIHRYLFDPSAVKLWSVRFTSLILIYVPFVSQGCTLPFPQLQKYCTLFCKTKDEELEIILSLKRISQIEYHLLSYYKMWIFKITLTKCTFFFLYSIKAKFKKSVLFSFVCSNFLYVRWRMQVLWGGIVGKGWRLLGSF